MKTLFE